MMPPGCRCRKATESVTIMVKLTLKLTLTATMRMDPTLTKAEQ